MSNETKRDVFEDALDAYDDSRPYPHPGYDSPAKLLDRYNAALPDDLPVIPELIGKYLKMWKHDHGDLFQAFDEGTSASLDGTKWESVQDWFDVAKDSFDTFARAWLLGVWRVEETGEIVKLEEEK
ncbi:hypothetical protein Lpl7_2797 [Lacticaseibacillus paracasei subsp. tolerans Lpl7]|uniref:Phage protein n=1 Tax=Lacticaseibacillus paracasei subsp. tolerans Lpl14 TaxID=1256229 RepID=A0A829GS11_LACPA|nr:hypothetical protein [Lacticaseibacillus paracasei]EPC12607.1 hypothetical protein Lpl7_2797 [Lacticaseibacillus paracasei subsp. tolerans Lpl7]EPC63037.1 hypothetical protein Lpl14_13692 [Lacticaseibacillus paracasei subsp. tolerans Lpl14]